MHVSSFEWNLISQESETSYCDSDVLFQRSRIKADPGSNFRRTRQTLVVSRSSLNIDPARNYPIGSTIRDVDPRRVNVSWKGYVKGYFGATTLVSLVINEGDEFINRPDS